MSLDLAATNKKLLLLALFTGFTLLALALVMLHLTGIIPAAGTWYSADPTLQLQTEAFLRGELAIQPLPYGHGPDWAWGNGMQEVWGLGVPLLQLPFQVLGKFVNGFGFPDHLIFLIFYLSGAALFWFALAGGGENLAPSERLKRRLLTLPILLYAFLNHALINMIQGKFERYEEVISYGFLWSLMLFALLAIFRVKRERYLYLLLCLLAGFALNLRPTIGAYGGLTFLVAFFLAWQGKVKGQFLGLALFLLGIGFFFLMNDLRFGSPFEAGHRLALTRTSLSDYIVRFDNPMTWVPFTAAALELLGALFFLDFHSTYADAPWQADIPIWREFNFRPYFTSELILLVLAWSLLLLFWSRHRQRRSAPPGSEEQLVAMGLIWSFLSFSLLFIFYTRWPGLVSRYLVDFAPAVVIAIASLYRYLVTWRASRPYQLLFGGLFISLTVLPLALSPVASIYNNPITATTLAGAQVKLKTARGNASGPPLPTEYRCGDFEIQYGIPDNNSEWRISGDCGVEIVTTHFFTSPECLEISLLPFNNAPPELKKTYSDQEIEVLVGTEPLHRVAEAPLAKIPGGKSITFCRSVESHRHGTADSPIEMVSIKWLNLRIHPAFETIPFALVSLKKVAR